MSNPNYYAAHRYRLHSIHVWWLLGRSGCSSPFTKDLHLSGHRNLASGLFNSILWLGYLLLVCRWVSNIIHSEHLLNFGIRQNIFWERFFYKMSFYNNRKDAMAKVKIQIPRVGSFRDLEPSVKLVWTIKSQSGSRCRCKISWQFFSSLTKLAPSPVL